ncbi:MAG: hypothetical protein WCL54_04500 [Clostridia bacterium]
MKLILIRYYKWIANGILLLLLAPTILLFVNRTLTGSTAFTLLIVEAFLGFGVVSFFKGLLMKMTLRTLYEKCDPFTFLKEATAFADGEREKRMKLNFLNWKLIGLLNCNRLSEALETQKSMESKFDTKIPVGLKATFAVSFASLSVARQELSLAEEWLQKAEQLSKDKNFRPLELKRVSHALRINRCEIDIMLAKYDGCEDVLQDILEFEVRKSVIIRAHFLLGKLFYNQKRLKDAEVELQFVLDHGNQLPEVGAAKELIEGGGL